MLKLMFANANDLQKRYRDVSVTGIIECAKKHLEEINSSGEHAKTTNGNWLFDEEAIRKLDEYFEYVPEKKAKPVQAEEEEDPLQQMANANQRLMQENAALRDAIEAADSKNIELTDEIQKLQASVVAVQDGRDAANSQLIRRNEQRAVRAEAKNKNLTKKLNETMEAKEKQAAELSARIEELQEKLRDATERLKSGLENNFTVLAAKESENRLFSKLAESEQQISDITAEAEDERALKEDAISQINDLKDTIKNASKQLESVISQLMAATEECDAEAEDESEEEQKEPAVVVEETAPDTVKTVAPKKRRNRTTKQVLEERRKKREEEVAKSTLEKNRDKIYAEMLAKQQEEAEAKAKAEKEEKEKKHMGFFSRIASLF